MPKQGNFKGHHIATCYTYCFYFTENSSTVPRFPERKSSLQLGLFSLLHDNNDKTGLICRDRLSASDMIHVQKVMEHVYEKIVIADNTPSTPTSQNGDKPNQPQMSAEELAALAEARIELHCSDTVRAS